MYDGYKKCKAQQQSLKSRQVSQDQKINKHLYNDENELFLWRLTLYIFIVEAEARIGTPHQ